MKYHYLYHTMALFALMAGLALGQQSQTCLDKHGNTLIPRIDPKTGSVKRLIGLTDKIDDYGLTREMLNEQSVQQLGNKLFDTYSPITKITSRDVLKKRIRTANNWWFGEYLQSYKGIPVDGSEIGFTIGPSGKILTFGANIYPNIQISVNPGLSSSGANDIAMTDFSGADAKVQEAPALYILPREQGNGFTYILTWRIWLFKHRPSLGSIVYFVDAVNGQIVQKRDLTENAMSDKRKERQNTIKTNKSN